MRRAINTVQKLLPAGMIAYGNTLYSRLPFSLRYGRHYRAARRILALSQYWTRSEHASFQLKSVRRLIQHAYHHIPFYRELYDKAGVHPEMMQSLQDIRRFPTIDKADLQQSIDRMKADNLPARAFQYHTTGGSTGQPVGLYWEADRTVPVERAFMQRQFEWIGFRMGIDRSILIRGIPVAENQISERVSPIDMRLSIYHMTQENLGEYVAIIQRFKPIAIQAYPSAAYILAQHILQSGGTSFPTLRVILCGSENIYPWQRSTIEAAFGCRAYSWYGHSEYAVLAGECEHSTRYHVYSEYGLTEVLLEDGTEAEPGMRGEIVATGFNNLAMPLIRYRTQDYARRSLVDSCECGRQYMLLDGVEGRLQEMIVSREGNLIPMTAINMHTDLFDNVLQFQFIQEQPGHLHMNIVPRSSYTESDTRRIHLEMMQKIGHQFTIEIDLVDSIPTTSSGKSRFLIQHLTLAQGHDASHGTLL